MTKPTASVQHLLSRRGALGHPWSTVTPPLPGTISFGGGIPDTATLPLPQLRLAAERALADTDGVDALQYGGSYGHGALREEIARRIDQGGRPSVSPEQVVITTGSSQALDIVCAAFIDPGDIVLVEEPTFPGSLWTFRAHGGVPRPVPIDGQGLDVEALAARLAEVRAEGRQTKLIYVTPDFQNPTGTRLPPERRRRLVELADAYDCLVVEDIAYLQIDYSPEPPPPTLFALAPDRVLQMGTFSKMIGPGLRVGWLVGPIVAVEAAARGRTDMGSSVTMSSILAQFLRDRALEPHLDLVREVYRTKRDAMTRALAETVGGLGTWDSPDGGFFLWLQLNDGVDVPALVEVARQERVGFVPGYRFLVEERPLPALRLAFSQVSLEDIQEGVGRLGRALERIG